MLNRASLIVLAFGLVTCVSWRPELLGNNEFLNGFIGADYLALLAVMLTVTLAAVATVRVSLARMISEKFANDVDKKAQVKDVIRETNHNAWVLILSFFSAFVVLLVEGNQGIAEVYRPHLFAVAIWIFFLHVLATIDVYRVMYLIADIE